MVLLTKIGKNYQLAKFLPFILITLSITILYNNQYEINTLFIDQEYKDIVSYTQIDSKYQHLDNFTEKWWSTAINLNQYEINTNSIVVITLIEPILININNTFASNITIKKMLLPLKIYNLQENIVNILKSDYDFLISNNIATSINAINFTINNHIVNDTIDIKFTPYSTFSSLDVNTKGIFDFLSDAIWIKSINSKIVSNLLTSELMVSKIEWWSLPENHPINPVQLLININTYENAANAQVYTSFNIDESVITTNSLIIQKLEWLIFQKLMNFILILLIILPLLILYSVLFRIIETNIMNKNKTTIILQLQRGKSINKILFERMIYNGLIEILITIIVSAISHLFNKDMVITFQIFFSILFIVLYTLLLRLNLIVEFLQNISSVLIEPDKSNFKIIKNSLFLSLSIVFFGMISNIQFLKIIGNYFLNTTIMIIFIVIVLKFSLNLVISDNIPKFIRRKFNVDLNNSLHLKTSLKQGFKNWILISFLIITIIPLLYNVNIQYYQYENNINYLHQVSDIYIDGGLTDRKINIINSSIQVQNSIIIDHNSIYYEVDSGKSILIGLYRIDFVKYSEIISDTRKIQLDKKFLDVINNVTFADNMVSSNLVNLIGKSGIVLDNINVKLDFDTELFPGATEEFWIVFNSNYNDRYFESLFDNSEKILVITINSGQEEMKQWISKNAGYVHYLSSDQEYNITNSLKRNSQLITIVLLLIYIISLATFLLINLAMYEFLDKEIRKYIIRGADQKELLTVFIKEPVRSMTANGIAIFIIFYSVSRIFQLILIGHLRRSLPFYNYSEFSLIISLGMYLFVIISSILFSNGVYLIKNYKFGDDN